MICLIVSPCKRQIYFNIKNKLSNYFSRICYFPNFRRIRKFRNASERLEFLLGILPDQICLDLFRYLGKRQKVPWRFPHFRSKGARREETQAQGTLGNGADTGNADIEPHGKTSVPESGNRQAQTLIAGLVV